MLYIDAVKLGVIGSEVHAAATLNEHSTPVIPVLFTTLLMKNSHRRLLHVCLYVVIKKLHEIRRH